MEKDGTNEPAEREQLDIDLREPWIAVVCAWLFPGAGHFYQRRYVKGVIFMVCILTTFFTGLIMGGGHVVYASWLKKDKRWQYVFQLGVGLPALPAIVQCRRARSREFVDDIRTADFDLDNQINEYELIQLFEIKQRDTESIKSLARYRPAYLLSEWDKNSDGQLSVADELPQVQPWFNGVMEPPGQINPYGGDRLADWHYQYGPLFDLGTLYTMIAGLLNLLAIFDAHAGPLILAKEEKKTKEKRVQKRMRFRKK